MDHHSAGADRAERLPRHLTFAALLFLMLNGIVGAGIFGMPQNVALLAGEWGVVMFPLCALLIFPVILVFAHLGSRFAGTGGPMLYVGIAFGAFAGFQTGWAFYVARLTAFAANINLLITTLAWFWSGLGATGAKIAALGLIIAGLAALNVRSGEASIRTLNILTVLKVLPLLGIVCLGFMMISEPSNPFAEITPDIGAAILLVIYAYVGFESGLVPAAEAKSPQKDIPRALIAALIIATVLYTGLYLVCERVLPGLAIDPQAVVSVGESLFGEIGGAVISATIAVSILGNLMGALFSTPRITYRLALDGWLPKRLASLHEASSMPMYSIALFAALAFLLAASGSFIWLASISVVVRLLIYLGCIASMHYAAKSDGLSLPGGPTIPLLAAAICLYLLTQASMTAWLATAALLLVGSVLWWVAAFGRSH